MRRFLPLLLMMSACTIRHPVPGTRLGATMTLHTIEGCHCPESGAWQFCCCMIAGPVAACQNGSPPQYNQAWAMVRIMKGSQGYICQTAEQHCDTDMLPGRASGAWQVAGSRAPPDMGAVVTRYQFTPSSGGGDGGQDEWGVPAGTPCLDAPKSGLLGMTARRKPGVLTIGTCIVAKDGTEKCSWTRDDR